MKKLSMPVEEFTTPDPVTAPETATVDELHRLMRDHGIRHIPILKDKTVIGVVSERDIKVASGLTSKEKTLVQAKDIMAPDPVTVPSDMSLDETAFLMSDRKIGSVIVNDEDGKFYGIFTATDALNALIEIARAARDEDAAH